MKANLVVKKKRKYIVRRLTPLECCRLQGFPDWWEDGVEGSDSARYKMWGNGIALPCAVDVLQRIVCAVKKEENMTTIPMNKSSHPEYTSTLYANEYQELAMRTCSIPYEDKVNMLTHATTGLASEAGEFAGLLQKVYQGHEYDREHALKELGDCCWMIAEACTALNATMEEVMRMNIDKLLARYPEGFDPEKSLHRKEGDV